MGWGGNGLAAAFEVLDGNARKVRAVVVKTLHSNEHTMRRRWNIS